MPVACCLMPFLHPSRVKQELLHDSGVGDVATLQALFAEDAPKNPNPIPVNQPIPETGQQRLLEEELKPSE